MQQFMHYQTCTRCGRENKGQLSTDPDPWTVGVAFCSVCRIIFSWSVFDYADRVKPMPEQLTLFPPGNGKTKG